MQVVLPAPGGACNTAQALSANVLCNRYRIVPIGRFFHGKPFNFYCFLKRDLFDMQGFLGVLKIESNQNKLTKLEKYSTSTLAIFLFGD